MAVFSQNNYPRLTNIPKLFGESWTNKQALVFKTFLHIYKT